MAKKEKKTTEKKDVTNEIVKSDSKDKKLTTKKTTEKKDKTPKKVKVAKVKKVAKIKKDKTPKAKKVTPDKTVVTKKVKAPKAMKNTPAKKIAKTENNVAKKASTVKQDPLVAVSTFLGSIKVKNLSDVLYDLMTEKEIKEFAERIEILKQLQKGVTQRVIAKNLGISVTTVSRGSKVLQTGKQVIKKYL